MSRDKLIQYKTYGVGAHDLKPLMIEIAESRGKDYDEQLLSTVASVPIMGQQIINAAVDEYLDDQAVLCGLIKIYDKDGKFIKYI